MSCHSQFRVNPPLEAFMRSNIGKGQTAVGRRVVRLPTGDKIEFEVVSQGSALLTTSYYVPNAKTALAKGIQDGGSCVYCNGVKLGCCPAGQDIDANCITGELKCVSRRRPGGVTFSVSATRATVSK
jgi:hypothetical protein